MERLIKPRRAATLASLAAELGVSRTTVSNAYNRPDQLSPELRRRVLDTARRLGYPGPDPVARSLRTRKAGAVGLLLTETLSYAFRDPAAIGFLEGLSLACEEAAQGLLLVPASPEGDDSAHSAAVVHRAAVDGFVVYSVPDDDPHLAAVRERPVPIVVCDQPLIDGVGHVGIDDHAAMAGVGAHLAGLGHRRVGVVCMRLGRERTDGLASVERQRGAHFHVQRARLGGFVAGFGGGVETPVVERFDNTLDAGASGAADLLNEDPAITAIVCLSDILAIGALQEVRRRGLRVPEDISITGFDGVPEAARLGLTTVRQPFREKGRVAGELLIAPDGGARSVVLDTELIMGSSTGPASAREDKPWFSGV